jgi:FAD binding domain
VATREEPEPRAGDEPARTGPRRKDLGAAVVDLAERVLGPVFDPYGADAVVELAAHPPDGLRRRLAVVGAVGTADVIAILEWAAEVDVAVAVPGTGLIGDPFGPTVVVALSRTDRIDRDPRTGRVRAGVGATWPAVAARLRAGQGVDPVRVPSCGTVGTTLACSGSALPCAVRALTVVGWDGVVRDVAPTARPARDTLGIVTGVVIGTT